MNCSWNSKSFTAMNVCFWNWIARKTSQYFFCFLEFMTLPTVCWPCSLNKIARIRLWICGGCGCYDDCFAPLLDSPGCQARHERSGEVAAEWGWEWISCVFSSGEHSERSRGQVHRPAAKTGCWKETHYGRCHIEWGAETTDDWTAQVQTWRCWDQIGASRVSWFMKLVERNIWPEVAEVESVYLEQISQLRVLFLRDFKCKNKKSTKNVLSLFSLLLSRHSLNYHVFDKIFSWFLQWNESARSSDKY